RPGASVFPDTTLFRSEAVEVFTIVGAREALSEAEHAFLKNYLEGYRAFHERRFREAAELLGGADRLMPGDQTTLYLFRLAEQFRSEEHTSELQSRENL